ncbi:MAG: glycosyltransferase [Brevibacillus sp.]|nr:glycosyltransferase [Brevibacillus sp.]
MNSKTRVLHVIGGGEFGGAEQHILNLLSSIPQDEFAAQVVCFYDSVFAGKLRDAGIPVVVLNQYGRFDIRLLGGLKQVMRSYQPDIVHSHGVKANFFARLAARGSGSAVLTTVHSYLRYDYVQPLAYLIVSLMEKLTRPLSHHFIAVSTAIQDILHKEGIAREKVSLIYNGINIKPFRCTGQREVNRTRLRSEWGIPEDAFVYGTVARFVPVKGLSYMIEAFAQAAKRLAPLSARLVMIGDGPERSLLEETAERLGVREQVVFTGFRSDIPACLHTFDAFVMSSLHEGLAYTVLEAVASEVPIVATAVGGIKEFVEPERTGLLVPSASADQLAQAMQRIAEDADLRAELAAAAFYKLKQSFTIEQMTAQTVALYRSLTAKRRLPDRSVNP